MNVSCQNPVRTGSRGTSASESRQAFQGCSFVIRDEVDAEKKFTLPRRHTNHGNLLVQVQIPRLKPVVNSRMSKSKPETESP